VLRAHVRCLRVHDARCIRRAPSRVDRVGLAERQDVRDLLRAVLVPASAHAQGLAHVQEAHRVPADYCPDQVRLPRDVPLAVLHHVAAATSATRRPKKAR
jgi:hypothetical protein